VGITKQLATVPAQAPETRLDPQANGNAVLDSGKIADILASIGEVPYEWDIRTNLLAVGRGCGSIRRGADRAPATPAAALSLATAALLCGDHMQSRRDTVLRADERDRGDGVLYRLRHRVHADGATKPVWIEDVGRWFAGPDGRPARAHGIMRVIDEPHAGENHGAPLLDDLTGEMNRRQFTELLADAPAGFVRDARRLDRRSRPRQRGLWLRRRRRGDFRGGAAAARQFAGRRSSRPVGGK
jgi:hypothetical protein